MRRNVLAVVGVLLVALLVPSAAEGCSCGQRPVCGEFWSAALVFIGRAERVSPLTTRGSERTEFSIRERLRGEEVGTKIDILAHGLGGSCDRSFTQGKDYLVFAIRRTTEWDRPRDGSWRVFLCSNTAELDQVPAADMAYMRRVLATPLPATLKGSAVLRGGRGAKPMPLVAARLTLRGGSRELTTRTDAHGTYSFDKVEPGEYALETETLPGVEPVAPARIAIGSGACAVHVIDARAAPARKRD
jgi:hypothetical protein